MSIIQLIYDSKKHKIIDNQLKTKVALHCPRCLSTNILVYKNKLLVCICRDCKLTGTKKINKYIRVEEFGEILHSQI